jgi:hypothetical protein
MRNKFRSNSSTNKSIRQFVERTKSPLFGVESVCSEDFSPSFGMPVNQDSSSLLKTISARTPSNLAPSRPPAETVQVSFKQLVAAVCFEEFNQIFEICANS